MARWGSKAPPRRAARPRAALLLPAHPLLLQCRALSLGTACRGTTLIGSATRNALFGAAGATAWRSGAMAVGL